MDAAANRVPAQRRVNIVGRIKRKRGAERILKDVGQLQGLLQREMPGDLPAAGFNRALDDGRGIQLVVQHDGQPLPDVVPGDFTEPFRALTVQPEINLRLAQVAAHRHGVFDDVAGQALLRFFLHDDLFDDRLAIGLRLFAPELFVTGRNRLVVLDDFVAVLLHHPEFQICGLLDVGLRLPCRPRTGRATGLKCRCPPQPGCRFGHAESVHALAQHLDRLRQRALHGSNWWWL